MFFSIVGYYRILTIVPGAIEWVTMFLLPGEIFRVKTHCLSLMI